MWICFDAIGSREGWQASTLFFMFVYWICFGIDGSLTNAIASNVPHNTVTSEVSLTVPTHHEDDECRNVTTDNRATTGLSVVGQGSGSPHSPIVPPTFLYGVLTCQPYQGISVNHIYFQLANAFFLLSHLAPSGIHGVLYLRCTLLVGCAFLALWGWTIACWLDAALWNALFVAINFVHVCTLLYKLRPIKFSREVEEVYIAVFQPLRVSRHQFKKVLNCMKVIRQLKYQEVYAQEKVTKVDSLSLVLSGKLVVSQNGRALHIVFPHQFLDSPEWFGVSTDEYFQVSITAMEESRILLWHRDKLKLSIISDQFLQAVFDHVLGRDVVKKLMQVSETMAASSHQQQNGQVIGLSGIGALENDPDTKLFVVKKTGDSQGITALISRQLQEERMPLLYTTQEVLNNTLHHINHPRTLPLHPVQHNNVQSSL
ncbi:blood vessel epicardial substance-like isoform X1 [Ceratina calcarata]|uniref:Blood vessel epicardial substance-like isoform X1 n=1 Tax=Ceratina calcarata TaxID=156304 RepID=A0AAJ7IX50_9HYME|nr:blood vessel epicardial substance-like isoform X1 [Ceratina calcarata]XP_017879044.1 blood vessel epicardial substance-like isoform X1 [Ceratina calcarata]